MLNLAGPESGFSSGSITPFSEFWFAPSITGNSTAICAAKWFVQIEIYVNVILRPRVYALEITAMARRLVADIFSSGAAGGAISPVPLAQVLTVRCGPTSEPYCMGFALV